MKNLNYFKNQVAEKHGFSSWDKMEETLKSEGLLQWGISRMHTAAELYAQSLSVEFYEWKKAHQQHSDCIQLETEECIKHFMKVSTALDLTTLKY